MPKSSFSLAWSAKCLLTKSRSSSAVNSGMRWMRDHIFSRASSLVSVSSYLFRSRIAGERRTFVREFPFQASRNRMSLCQPHLATSPKVGIRGLEGFSVIQCNQHVLLLIPASDKLELELLLNRVSLSCSFFPSAHSSYFRDDECPEVVTTHLILNWAIAPNGRQILRHD